MEKLLEEITGGEKVTINQIVNDLKAKNYNIVQKTAGGNTVLEIVLNTSEIIMDKNSEESIEYTIKYLEGIIQYFAEVKGKYYEIKLENEQITVSTEETK